MNMLKFRNVKNLSSKFYNFQKAYGVSQNIINYRSESNPQVFFSISKNGQNIGKITFEVFNFFILSFMLITALKLLRISDNYVPEKVRRN